MAPHGADEAGVVKCEMCRGTGLRLAMCRLCEEVPAEEDSSLCEACQAYLELEDAQAHERAHGPEVSTP